jgi:phosphoglycerol transferase MdoB-like AlkP superfamily enzyme
MESYEAWPLFAEFADLKLGPELSRLAQEGVSIPSFLPASSGTMESLAALITGWPDAGVHTNYQATAQTAYASSVPAQFKRLGFRTRLFYGGYLSWQRVGKFAQAQGFDKVYGGGHMGDWNDGNEWGVDDEYLFDFVANTQTDDAPTFSLILSTIFHPPFDIDVAAKGFVLPELPSHLKSRCSQTPDAKMLGHFWYADRCLGEFVRRVKDTLPNTLFAITGDHAGRRSITDSPSPEEKTFVPCVFFGPDVLQGQSVPADAVGTHIDIGASLLALSMEPGERYFALGNNLFSPTPAPVAVNVHSLLEAGIVKPAGEGTGVLASLSRDRLVGYYAR